MKRLIVNADDFGFTKGVNEAIVRAFSNGIVTSTSIMANGAAFEPAVELAHKNPALGVGCHLSIVGGKAIADPETIRSLVSMEGLLPETLQELSLGLIFGRIRAADILTEFRAQMERVTSSGIRPTHLDTHKHSQVLPQVMEALVKVAAEFKVPCVRNPYEDKTYARIRGNKNGSAHFRQFLMAKVVQVRRSKFIALIQKNNLATPDYFFGTSLTGLMDATAIHRFLIQVKEGTTEMMCHPGFYDADLGSARTRLKNQRQNEFSILTDPDIRTVLEEHKIQLMSYAELAVS
jgi:hopanoid biosynthesis associated protein HpnK